MRFTNPAALLLARKPSEGHPRSSGETNAEPESQIFCCATRAGVC